MRPVATFSSAVFAVIAFAQLLRVVFRVPVTAAGISIPLWMSGVLFFVLAVLAFLLFRESRT